LDIFLYFQVPVLKEKLAEKEQQLHEMGQKYSSNKQVLTESWHQAAAEVRRQYEAIDSALEVRLIIQLLEGRGVSWSRSDLQHHVKGTHVFKVFVYTSSVYGTHELIVWHSGSQNFIHHATRKLLKVWAGYLIIFLPCV
jgi:hypothetical protein